MALLILFKLTSNVNSSLELIGPPTFVKIFIFVLVHLILSILAKSTLNIIFSSIKSPIELIGPPNFSILFVARVQHHDDHPSKLEFWWYGKNNEFLFF